jgi:hypothetical protein
MSKLTRTSLVALKCADDGGLVDYLGYWRLNIDKSAIAPVFNKQTITALYKRGLVEYPMPGLCVATRAGQTLLAETATRGR